MRTIHRIIATLLGTMCSASAVIATVTITPGSQGVEWNRTSVGTPPNEEYIITFNTAGSYTVASNDGDDVIQSITKSSSGTLTLSITTGIRRLERLLRATGITGEINVNSLNVFEDLGEAGQQIQAHNLQNVTVGRHILGNIVNPGSPNSGTFGTIQTTTGDLKGNVINNYGGIDAITVAGDIIGTSGDVVIHATGLITTISATNFTSVQIGEAVGSPVGSNPSTLGKVDDIRCAGDFVGSLNGTVVKRVLVDNDLIGDVVIESMVTEELALIVIGRNLDASSHIVFPLCSARWRGLGPAGCRAK